MRRTTLSALTLGSLLLLACQQAPPASPTTPTSAPSAKTAPARPAPRTEPAAPAAKPSPAAADPVRKSAYRAQSPEYGLSAFVMGHAETTERDLRKITDLGFGWVKLTFPWRSIERDGRGKVDWEESDRVVRAARAAGLRIIARLDFQPEWARDDKAPNGPPDKDADFGNFVGAFVSRYKQGSSIGPVDAIQVWNEVNLNREWGNEPINAESAEDYVRLLKAAYQAAKKADPGITVISAGLSPTGTDDDAARPDDVYLRWMYKSGAKQYFDVLGANANVQCPCIDPTPGSVEGFSHPSFYFRRVEQLRQIMVENGDADKQVWLMEFGWTTDRVHPAYAWYATTEEKKSELIVQAFRYAREHWAPWIGVMTLWTVADPAWGPEDEQVWWSITNPDGSVRPAYERLLQARRDGGL